MSAIGDKVRNKLQYAGLSKETFDNISDSIRQQNLHTMTYAAEVACVLCVGLFIATYLMPGMAQNRMVYLCLTALVFVFFLLCRYVLPGHPRGVLPAIYLVVFLVFMLSIVLGVLHQTDMPATTFCVLLFALPLLIIDKPWRVSALLTVVSVIFMVSSVLIKSPAAYQLDLINAISFLILGLVVNYNVMRTKLRDVANTRIITQQRDTDDLTRLLNKAAARRAILHYMANSREPAALLVLDVDNFKQVNDTLGHAVGDDVLSIIGKCALGAFRRTDICARFGGDEFIVFLPNAVSRDAVEKRIRGLMESLSAQFGKRRLSVTCSIGVALYPKDDGRFETLFAKADQALYASKHKGKHCCTFYGDIEPS